MRNEEEGRRGGKGKKGGKDIAVRRGKEKESCAVERNQIIFLRGGKKGCSNSIQSEGRKVNLQ